MTGKIGAPRIDEQIRYTPSQGEKGPKLEIPLNGRKIKISDPTLQGTEQQKILILAAKAKNELADSYLGRVLNDQNPVKSSLIIKIKPTSMTERVDHFFRKLFKLGTKPLTHSELNSAHASIEHFEQQIGKQATALNTQLQHELDVHHQNELKKFDANLNDLENLYAQLKNDPNNKDLKSTIRTAEKTVTDKCQELKIANPKMNDLTLELNALHADLNVLTTRYAKLFIQKDNAARGIIRWEAGQKPEKTPPLTEDEKVEFEKLDKDIASKKLEIDSKTFEINRQPLSKNTENTQVNIRHVREQLSAMRPALPKDEDD